MAALTGLDIFILIVMTVSVITGLFRGFVKELMSLGVWFLAIWSAAHFSSLGADFIKPWVHQPQLRGVASFVSIIILVLLLGGISSNLLGIVIHKSGLSGTDRVLGMVFGFSRAVFIVSLLIVVAKLSGFPDAPYTSQSKLYPKFKPVASWMASFAPKWLDKLKDLNITTQEITLAEEVDYHPAANPWRQINIKTI